MTEYTLIEFNKLFDVDLQQNNDGHYILSSDLYFSIVEDKIIKIREGETFIINGFLGCFGGEIINEGTIIVNDSVQVIQNTYSGKASFVNKGTININNGGTILISDGEAINYGIINNNDGGKFSVLGGEMKTLINSVINNNNGGRIEINGGEMKILDISIINNNSGGIIDINGMINDTHGAIIDTSSGILDINDEIIDINSGIIDINGKINDVYGGLYALDNSIIQNNNGGRIKINSGRINSYYNSIINTDYD